jgi:hypothetical protein
LLMQAYADGHMRGHESTVEGWFSSDAEEYAREWMKENADRIERARERERKASGSAPDGCRLLAREPSREMLYMLAARSDESRDDAKVGKEHQRRVGTDVVPPRYEYEAAVGFWFRFVDRFGVTPPASSIGDHLSLHGTAGQSVSLPPASAPEVTDAQLERAYAHWSGTHPDSASEEDDRKWMRNVLTAALTEKSHG